MKVKIPEDKEWKNQRQKRWEDVWENALRVIGISKQEKNEEDQLVAARKQWYLEGNLTPLIQTCKQLNTQQELDLRSVLELCPITDLDVYLQFIKDYSIWLSERKISYWEPNLKDRNVSFFKSLFSLYTQSNLDSTEEIFAHMLGLIVPDDNGVVEFPYKLGVDHWQPEQEVSQCTVSYDLLESLGRYLFAPEKESTSYKHLSTILPSIRWIKDLDPGYFNTVLIDGKPKRPAPPPAPRRVSASGQKLIRAVIGNLVGYKSYYDEYEGPLRHNDLDVEKQLKDLIDSLDMPEEYHRMIEFIHAHPDDFVKRSE